MTPSSQAETGLDSFIFVAVKTLLWLCYGRTNVILIPSLLFTQSCCWWPRPKSTHHTRHVTRTRHVGPVSGVQWQDTCPVSSVHDTFPVSSELDTSCGARVRCPVTVHVSSIQRPGHVSSIQWQDTCPLSSVQDTCVHSLSLAR